MARSESGRLADKLDQLLDLDRTCDLEQFYEGKKWRALLRAAERMQLAIENGGMDIVRSGAQSYSRAKARILGEKSRG